MARRKTLLRVELQKIELVGVATPDAAIQGIFRDAFSLAPGRSVTPRRSRSCTRLEADDRNVAATHKPHTLR